MDIGSFLAYRRKQLGLSFSDVGSAIGYTPQAIYRYEKGIVKIDLSLVDSFCKVLNLSAEAFFEMDTEKITPYQNEKFSQDAFCSLLQSELSKEPGIVSKIAAQLSISPSRVEKWSSGDALPSVDYFVLMSDVLGYKPADLYLGRAKQIAIPPKPIRWKLPLIAVASALAISAGILVPFALSRLNPGSSSSSGSPTLTTKQTCQVQIQGYDVEDQQPIASLSYRYTVDKGGILKDFNPTSPYYDYVYSWHGGDYFNFADTPIDQDISIKAFFSKKTFTVTFLGYNDEVLGISKARYLSSADAPSFVPDQGDFRFVGWKESFDCVESDLTVHSLFSRFRSNLLLDFAGGEVDGEGSDACLGYTAESYSALPKPKKKGHRFLYYADSEGRKFDENYKLEGESTKLHAVYEALIYRIHFEGMDSVQEVAFGSQVTELPTTIGSTDIVLGWMNGGKKITLPFTYEDDFDITLTPMLASEFFDYELKGGQITLKKAKKWESQELDLSALGSYPVTKISTHAIKDLNQVESLTFAQSQLNLESSCFENLPSLRRVDFAHLDSSSRFGVNAFANCPNVAYLRSGTPFKNDAEPLKLKEYGLEGGNGFTFEFNEASQSIPSSWNDDFGVLGELRLGNGIQGAVEIHSRNCKILRFIPGQVSYSMLTAELPDLEQEEMRFYGTSLVRLEGEKFGKVKRFVMENGGVSFDNRNRSLEVEEFDMSRGKLIALRNQQIKANRLLLPDTAKEGYFAPLSDRLEVDFYGCKSMPAELISRGAFLDRANTAIRYHAEKRYDEDATIDYPTSIFDW